VADTLNVALPVHNTTLDASASYDPDGTIKSYKWSFVNGPQIASVLSPDSSKTTVNNLIAGTYTFNVTVTDNDGAISNAEVAVVVSYSNNRLNTRSISVYPNPVQGITNVIMDSDVQGNANLMLTDINGSTLLRQDFVKNSGAQTLQVNMSNLRPGVYILTIQVGGTRIATKKLMKL